MPRGKEYMTASQLANIEPYKFKKGQSGNPKGSTKNRVKQYLKNILPKSKLKKTEGLTMQEINTIEKKVLEVSLLGKITPVRPEDCIACGQCEMRCPDFAIFVERRA